MSWWPAATVCVALAGLGGCAEQAAPDGVVPGEQVMLEGVVVTSAIVPIPGAVVRVVDEDVANTTDATGRFVLGPLDPGTYDIIVKADGYADARVQATLRTGQDNRLNVALDAVATTVPYHQVLHLQASIECSYAQRFAGVIGGNFNCLGLTELLLGIKLGDDVDRLPFTVEGGNFRGLLVEMVWKEQATMPYFSGMIRDPVGVGGGVGLENQYWSGVSRSPLVALVVAGQENDGAYTDDVFHPDGNASASYEFLIAGMSDSSKPVDVAIALEQELDLFLSMFYHALPPPEYGVVPKE